MERTNSKQFFAIVMIAASFVGVISYFLPFIDFFVTYSWINYASESESVAFVPVVLSVVGLVCSVMFALGKERLIYAAFLAESTAIEIVFNAMNSDNGFISASDFSGLGYTLFLIAHCAAFLACVIYAIISSSKGKKRPAPVSKSETKYETKSETKYETKACVNCGKTVNKSVMTCPYCGKSTVVREAVPMKTCLYCGKKYVGDPKTCPHCGKSTKKTILNPVNKCRFCESVLDADAAFCPVCGKPVKSEASVKLRKDTCSKCGRELPLGSSVCPVCSKEKDIDLGEGWYISDDLG